MLKGKAQICILGVCVCVCVCLSGSQIRYGERKTGRQVKGTERERDA